MGAATATATTTATDHFCIAPNLAARAAADPRDYECVGSILAAAPEKRKALAGGVCRCEQTAVSARAASRGEQSRAKWQATQQAGKAEQRAVAATGAVLLARLHANAHAQHAHHAHANAHAQLRLGPALFHP